MRKGSHCEKRDLPNMMFTRLVANAEKINEAQDLDFVLEKSTRIGNKVQIYKRMKDGTLGHVYLAPNCAIASVWIDAYALAWATAHGK